MNKLLTFAAILLFSACINGNTDSSENPADGQEDNDTTIYGICGTATSMHSLQLITTLHDTLAILLIGDSDNDTAIVAGGLMSGDRMAVTARGGKHAMTAQRVMNITSLLGRWTSIDKDFEIAEDGEVKSNVKAETNAWTEWRIFNGHLLLNRDTFDVVNLTADSLDLENGNGIYSFRRITAIVPEEEPADSTATQAAGDE